MRFNYEHFEKKKTITQLMKCIWIYSDSHGKRCKVCKTYKNWAILAMKQQWLSCYIDFDTVVKKLVARDPQYEYITHIPAGFCLYLLLPTIRIPNSSATTTTTATATATATTAERLIK